MNISTGKFKVKVLVPDPFGNLQIAILTALSGKISQTKGVRHHLLTVFDYLKIISVLIEGLIEPVIEILKLCFCPLSTSW